MGAVQACDYALPEFRMLWRVLLVHGRWNYIRISEMILYFFYKNMLFTVPQLVFAFYCAFSGQSLFDDWYISFYNLLFTSLPLVVRAILEQDVNYVFKKTERITPESTMTELKKGSTKDPVLERQAQYLPEKFGVNKFFFRLFPKIYFIGQENCIFNYTNYFLWVVEAFVEAILITIFCMYIIGSVSINEMGYNSDVWLVGVTTYFPIYSASPASSWSSPSSWPPTPSSGRASSSSQSPFSPSQSMSPTCGSATSTFRSTSRALSTSPGPLGKPTSPCCSAAA